MISERAIHDMVMETILAASHGAPAPDFGPVIYRLSREQLHRLNRAYDDTRNQYAVKRWRAKR